MSGKYNEYCMKFSNEEIVSSFYLRFNKELRAEAMCLSKDGDKINFLSDEKIETIAFDKKENIAITFWGYQTSIYAYEKEIMFIDEDSKGTYTLSDIYDNVVYEGKLREMSHEQMLDMFAEIILCFIDAKAVQVIQLDVPTEKGYKSYNYYDPHMFIIDVDNGHVDKQSKTFENITINY